MEQYFSNLKLAGLKALCNVVEYEDKDNPGSYLRFSDVQCMVFNLYNRQF